MRNYLFSIGVHILLLLLLLGLSFVSPDDEPKVVEKVIMVDFSDQPKFTEQKARKVSRDKPLTSKPNISSPPPNFG